MYKGSRSRFFPIVVVLIIIAIVVAAFVGIGRLIFGGGGAQQPAAQVTTLSSRLLDTSESHGVSMTVRGPIVGDEDFRSFEISISPTARTLNTWKGYDRSATIDSKTLPNDIAAYRQFVHALDYAGFSKSADVKSDDTNGLCANGKVYDFNLLINSSSTDRRWTTNCGIKGSFAGNGPQVRELFLDQIPDAPKLVNKTDL